MLNPERLIRQSVSRGVFRQLRTRSFPKLSEQMTHAARYIPFPAKKETVGKVPISVVPCNRGLETRLSVHRSDPASACNDIAQPA